MSRAGREQPTVAAVAALANVSVATVSRALRGFDNVAPTTAERVLAAANELGYRPNLHAASLRSGTTHAVTIVVPDLAVWYHAEVMAGAEAVLSDAGYDTLVSVAATPEAFEYIIESCEGATAPVDGLIFVEQNISDENLARLAMPGTTPTVVAGHLTEGVSSVAVNDFEIGRLAATHLIEHGHRRIGLIEGTGHRTDHRSAQVLRHRGFMHVMNEAGLVENPELRTVAPYTAQGGKDAIVHVLAASIEPPTAVFCTCDLIALGAMRALLDLGFDVPRDISIVGVDDHEMAPIANITTIRQPVGEIGAEAARLLLAQLDGAQKSAHVQLDVALVLRNSSGPAPNRER